MPSTQASFRQYALAADAFADPAGALGVPERALVEGVDLHLEAVEADLDDEVPLEHRGRRRRRCPRPRKAG